MRDYSLYLEDILQAIKNIQKYTNGLPLEKFEKDNMIIDAAVRNLEIIGEAAKNIPKEIKNKASGIEWEKIAGLRNILAHEYFGVDVEIIWDVIKNKLPVLKKDISSLLKEM